MDEMEFSAGSVRGHLSQAQGSEHPTFLVDSEDFFVDPFCMAEISYVMSCYVFSAKTSVVALSCALDGDYSITLKSARRSERC